MIHPRDCTWARDHWVFGGGKGPGKGESLGSTGAGGVTGGGGSYAGEGGTGASGPAGLRYGSGGLDLLMGGSGGGIGNGGEAGAGGGAIEMISSGTVRIEPGVRVAMNGGTVLLTLLLEKQISRVEQVQVVRFGFWPVISRIWVSSRLKAEIPRAWIQENQVPKYLRRWVVRWWRTEE